MMSGKHAVDGSRLGRRRRLVTFVPAIAILVILTGSASSGRSPVRPVVTAPAAVAFRTLLPGSALPSDETCAGKVESTPEPVPANARYNSTAGQRRLPDTFFDAASDDPRAITGIAPRVSGRYTGTTAEIMEWVACKWGIDENLVRAQAWVESSWRQAMTGDWTSDPARCVPGHEPGVDGRPGSCPESWGLLQVRYHYLSGAFPDAISSTAFNADTAYAVWRACYEGYELWLRADSAPGYVYRAGDAWGCIGRWYSGAWYTPEARRYIDCVKRIAQGREPCAS
jgi:hypothetical protein